MDEIQQLDAQLFLTLNDWGGSFFDNLFLIITNKYYAIPLYAFLLFLLIKAFGWKKALLSLVFVGLMIATSDQCANLFKKYYS